MVCILWGIKLRIKEIKAERRKERRKKERERRKEREGKAYEKGLSQCHQRSNAF